MNSTSVGHPAIELKRVERAFRTSHGSFHALRKVDLKIDQGEIFGIIGRSGAGKSTLLRTINLLERPDRGQVFIGGEDVTQFAGNRIRQLRQRATMVFQHFNLLNSKTVEENVRFPLRVAATMTRAQQIHRVHEVLDLVGIAEQARKYPSRLSGGQRQRVGIARALANYPDILLCDEATSALDPQTTQAILALLLEINMRLGLTLVLITHSMDVIRSVADRVAVIDAGQIVESGAVVDVFLRPRHAITRALLAESGMATDALSLSVGSIATRLVRLTYQGDASHATDITRLSRESGLEFALLEGSVGRFKDVSYGQFTIAIDPADDAALAQLHAAAAAHSVQCEVLR